MKPSTMAYAQPLRAVSLLSTALALPLCIASTVVSLRNEYNGWYRHRAVTALCFPYLGLSVTAALGVAALLKLRKTGKPLRTQTVYADLLAFVLYLAVLIPIWAREIRELYRPGHLLLVSYTTVPLILNMILHAIVVVRHVAVQLPSWTRKTAVHCPNCQATIGAGVPQEVRQASKGEGYSLLRGEDYLDEDAVHYKDARESEDLLRSRASEETQAGEGESQAKGKIALEV